MMGPDQFRLWTPESDPAPRYKEDIERQESNDTESIAVEVNINSWTLTLGAAAALCLARLIRQRAPERLASVV
jgi:hypothetical protein